MVGGPSERNTGQNQEQCPQSFGGIKRRDLPKSSTRLPLALSWSGLMALLICQSTVHERAARAKVPWLNVCHVAQCSLTLTDCVSFGFSSKEMFVSPN